jgi:hypothetical protein
MSETWMGHTVKCEVAQYGARSAAWGRQDKQTEREKTVRLERSH